MSVNDQRQFSAAAWVIDKRLSHAVSKSKMLQGLTYLKEGSQTLKGEDNLPSLTPWTLSSLENIFAGAPKPPKSDLTTQNTVVQNNVTLIYRLSTSRRNGWLARDSKDPKGLMDWLSLIMDAIETNSEYDEDEADSTLETALAAPVKFSIQETETSELSYTIFLEVELQLQPTCRAERSLNLAERTEVSSGAGKYTQGDDWTFNLTEATLNESLSGVNIKDILTTYSAGLTDPNAQVDWFNSVGQSGFQFSPDGKCLLMGMYNPAYANSKNRFIEFDIAVPWDLTTATVSFEQKRGSGQAPYAQYIKNGTQLISKLSNGVIVYDLQGNYKFSNATVSQDLSDSNDFRGSGIWDNAASLLGAFVHPTRPEIYTTRNSTADPSFGKIRLDAGVETFDVGLQELEQTANRGAITALLSKGRVVSPDAKRMFIVNDSEAGGIDELSMEVSGDLTTLNTSSYAARLSLPILPDLHSSLQVVNINNELHMIYFAQGEDGFQFLKLTQQ